MDEANDRYTIGELARRTGLSTRTIRFWSDNGVLPPAERSAGGYRLYRADAVGRLHLARTLRELGLGLDSVREVLDPPIDAGRSRREPRRGSRSPDPALAAEPRGPCATPSAGTTRPKNSL
ncbi:helix-turn-helix domain-containing protein [Amycolatopsis sp. A1MSW2902]|uniref:helix-turn-helix domain-containing protein n=1 Tax=Amycolatopsis sp. A1MSW2902 TaxID=687413 RepID=UPI00307D9FE9